MKVVFGSATMAVLAIGLWTAAVLVAERPPPDAQAGASRSPPELPPFMEVFLSRRTAAVATQSVEWPSAIGSRQGLLVRPDGDERLPALLLIEVGPASGFLKRTAQELAEIGYVVLLVELLPAANEGSLSAEEKRERALAQMSSAVRWLRRRNDVFPDRIGAMGWAGAAQWALELAAAQGLLACVLGDGTLPFAADAELTAGLSHTILLLVQATADATPREVEHLSRFERALEAAHVEFRLLPLGRAKTGFLDSQRQDAFDFELADRTWVEIYEFLGRHVEDAAPAALPVAGGTSSGLQPAGHLSSVADLMRAVNAPAGVRGQLSRALAAEPRDEKAWRDVRARAALMADTGDLLAALRPPKGSQAGWQRRAASYRDAAANLTAAADRRDFTAAIQDLERLNASCGKCHLDHR